MKLFYDSLIGHIPFKDKNKTNIFLSQKNNCTIF